VPAPAISVQKLRKLLDGKPVLDGVDLEVGAGRRLGIIGPAAGGKSVLLKLMCGLMEADAGSVRIGDAEVTAMTETDRMQVRRDIGMLFQNYALFDFMTVRENVAFPLIRLGGIDADEIEERVVERLRRVGLAGSEDKIPAELSGGMKKRLGIARATVAKPALVIYDEPTAGLDPVTTSKIYDLILADQAETGCTIVAVSSDVAALVEFSDDLAMLYGGVVRHAGPAREIAEAGDPLVRQFVSGDLEGPLP
jgi:phospholipid/cholesterol/gamma-HCH transport system ATP-binding protein